MGIGDWGLVIFLLEIQKYLYFNFNKSLNCLLIDMSKALQYEVRSGGINL